MDSPADSSLPLRERVYDHLKELLNQGSVRAGDFLDLPSIGATLGLSRTPLRDALLRLEVEGFVDIHPRRGVMVRPLDLGAIRDIYQMIGALESAALIETGPGLGMAELDRMEGLNGAMHAALSREDFRAYYEANLAFHDAYIAPSHNSELKRTIRILKERLYDFPRRSAWVREWEERSADEHGDILKRLRVGDFGAAAAEVRDRHWSFSAQESYVLAYYFSGRGGGA